MQEKLSQIEEAMAFQLLKHGNQLLEPVFVKSVQFELLKQRNEEPERVVVLPSRILQKNHCCQIVHSLDIPSVLRIIRNCRENIS